MNTARWKQMVAKEYDKWLDGPQERGWLSIPETLLARQHAAMVRKVKRLDRYSQGVHIMLGNPDGEFILRSDILAALKAQGRKKK